MSQSKSVNRGSIYWKNLSIVLMITCIPVALISTFLYYMGTDQVKLEVNKTHQNQLAQSIQHMEDYLTHLEHTVVRLAFDGNLDKNLRTMDFIWEFNVTNELMKSLTLMRQSNALIGGVDLYLRNGNKLISEETGYQTLRNKEDLRLLNALLEWERAIYWDYSLKKPGLPGSLYKGVVIKLPGGQISDAYGAFIIYLDQAKLNEMVEELSSGDGISFLINANGEYLTTPREDASSSQIGLKDALRDYITGDHAQEASFTYKWKHQDYAVSYGQIATFGGKWTFVTATPLSQIVAPVTSLSRLILWISLSGMLLGILLSWFASNKIYDPIQRLKRMFVDASRDHKTDEKNEITYIEKQWIQQLMKQQTLSKKLEQSLPALRENMLNQFLQGHLYSHTEPELIDKMKQLGWDLEQKRYAVMVTQLHGIAELGDKFSARDSQLLTFAATNILSELCSDQFEMIHVMNFQELSSGVFFVLDSDNVNEVKAILNKLAHDYIAAVNNMLRMKVTIVTSKISDTLTEMPDVLEKTRKALRFRDLHMSNQMLDLNQFMMDHVRSKQFPSGLEREIAHAVSIGLEEEAVRLIRQFMHELQRDDSTALLVHQGMMKLLGTLHDTILKHDVNLYELYEGAHLYEQLMQLSEPEQIVEWFRDVLIRPFIRTLSINYDGQLREMIDKLLIQIQEEITTDISLEKYADQLQMSPSKLSKVFRQIHGSNFIDTIVRLRIEKCKELLCTTDMKINDIAELLRYQPSYLIRMFKKSEGITPRQYREKHADKQ